MRRARIVAEALTITLALLVLVTSARADTYSTFTTRRYYSTNRHYFVEVTPERRASLYRVDSRQPRRQWTGILPALPGRLLVANDGSRVAVIDRYYGNARDPNMPAVVLLNGTGKEIARYRLSEVADLSRVLTTTSSAHWYSTVAFTPNEDYLIIDTIVAKRDRATCTRVNSAEEADDCFKSTPYEQLRFGTADGKLISRTNIAALVN